MGVKVDLTGIELRTFEPLPAGRYMAEVADLIYSPASKRSGAPKVQFTFTLLKGIEDATKDVEVANRKAFYEVSLQEQSLWNLKRTLAALGDNPEDLAGEIELEKEDYVGRPCVLVLGIEEYEGVSRQRTRRVEPMAA